MATTTTWTKAQTVTSKVLDLLLTFGAGVMLDPSVAKFIGSHQGVATGVAVGLAVLRAAEKTLGSKATSAASASKAPTGPTV